MDIRAKDIIAYTDATASFSFNLRIEKAEGSRIRATISSFRKPCQVASVQHIGDGTNYTEHENHRNK